MNGKEVSDFIDITATASRPIDPDRAIPSWTTKDYDFGTVPDGDTVRYDYVITNTGRKPLLLIGSETDCGCTVPVYKDKPIAPGQSEIVQVQFNSTGKVGRVDKKISIFTNTVPGRHTLQLSGIVTARDTI